MDPRKAREKVGKVMGWVIIGVIAILTVLLLVAMAKIFSREVIRLWKVVWSLLTYDAIQRF